MDNIKKLSLILMGLWVIWAQAAGAQSVLRLARVDTVGSQLVYSYEVKADRKAPRNIARVGLDISAPKGKIPPFMLGASGNFMFDALKSRYNAVLISHAPLFMGTPRGWFGFVGIDGEAGWWSEERMADIKPGGIQGGMVLKSPALPGIRKWTVGPAAPLPDADDPDAPVDASYNTWSGYVLGPGWMASDVTGQYFKYQVDMACQLKMAESKPCTEYRTWALALTQSEKQGSDQAYLEVLRAFRTKMGQDPKILPIARLVWNRTVEALATRPPSKRSQINN